MNTEDKIRNIIEDSVTAVIAAVQKGLRTQTFANIVGLTTNVVHQLGTTLIEEIVAALDEQYNSERDRHSVITRNYKSRRMITQIGEVTLRRRLYYDKRLKHYFFAADELLEIEKCSRIDIGLKEELITNATLTSYGKASEIAGYKVSRQTVHNIVKKLPKEYIKVQARKQPVKKINNIYIEADEDHIHLNTGMSAEVKLVYVHEGAREICCGRRELINPKYFTSAGKKDNEIWNEVFEYVYSQYDVSDANIHISGDGAQWIKNGIDYFPQAQYHLDKFHVYKSVTDVSGANKSMRKEIIEALKIKDFEKISELYAIQSQNVEKTSMRKNIAKGLFYLENNLDEIDLTKTSCCAAEGHVSHVLSARMSSRPMGWSLCGADKIAKLRAYYFSGGNFAEMIGNRAKFEAPFQAVAENKNRYKHIAKRVASDNGVASAHVVGLDGITNGLSVLLRAAVRK